jgi:hypothetical protein
MKPMSISFGCTHIIRSLELVAKQLSVFGTTNGINLIKNYGKQSSVCEQNKTSSC